MPDVRSFLNILAVYMTDWNLGRDHFPRRDRVGKVNRLSEFSSSDSVAIIMFSVGNAIQKIEEFLVDKNGPGENVEFGFSQKFANQYFEWVIHVVVSH